MCNDYPAVLIAFLEQDNLGVGYMASMLLQEKESVKILDFNSEKQSILEKISSYQPKIIGFSVIFQYHINKFKIFIDFLRKQGVSCHFTVGGHYPSLRCNDTFNILDKIDSIVLFEGEHTFLELVKKIHKNEDWKTVKGIAYRERDKIIQNELRPLENDLDNFPPPARKPLKEYAFGKKYATLIAGRGCYYNCSFCSIRNFYSKPPGPIKRLRRAEMVVREMELLNQQYDCSVFMFQDDDFPVTAENGSWIVKFCSLLHEKGLSDKIIWKINCRADEVSYDSFLFMKKAGLFLVYLGIESGTEEGLKLMNKRLSLSDNFIAIEILKKLDICYDYGFMIFEPSSTVKTVNENLDFLNIICGDGSSPITFCKMLPYAETQIEQQLLEQGRLKEQETGFFDYDFFDSSLNKFCPFLIDCFYSWISSHDGLLNLARWTRYYLLTAQKFYSKNKLAYPIKEKVDALVSKSNLYFISTAKQVLDLIDSSIDENEKECILFNVKNEVREKHDELIAEFVSIMETIKNEAMNTDISCFR